MMRAIVSALLTMLSPLALIGASAPVRIATADYFGGYAGTHLVAPEVAARWLTWSETNLPTSLTLRPLGVKTMVYSDPNRAMAGDPEFTSDDSTFAHDCSGSRISANRAGQYLMDPRSPALRAIWKKHAVSYATRGNFNAIFEDDANTVRYVKGQPCNYSASQWLQATIDSQASIGYPIVYNGLGSFSDRTVSPSIALNQTAIGGMMEECYGALGRQSRIGGDHWYVAEQTELAMAAQKKLFFCLDNDVDDAASSTADRMYVLASFLLTYDPATSILWELFATPSRLHIMPEVQLVPQQPQVAVSSASSLVSASGIYERRYAQCYLAGRPYGPCVVAVNPDTTTHSLTLPGYTRTLKLSGAGVLDGGTANIAAPGPPPELQPLMATIAFK